MHLIFGREKKDVIRYIILGLLFIVGIVLTWSGGFEIKFFYLWLLFLGVIRIEFKKDTAVLEDVFYALNAFVVGSYIDHSLIIFNSSLVDELGIKSVTMYSLLVPSVSSYIVEFFVIVGVYCSLRLLFVPGKFAAIFAPVPTLMLCLADYFVFCFRSNELAPLDFLSIRTAMNVAGNYDFPFKRPLYLVYIPVILYVFSVFVFNRKQEEKKAKNRIILLTVYALLTALCVCLTCFSSSHFAKTRRTEYFGSRPSTANGFITNFSMQIQSMHPQKPTDYDANMFSELYDFSSSIDEKPTIIVIMNESWADLSIYEDQTGAFEDTMPFIRSLEGADNVRSGYAYSSVFGGNTANSEFEFLTGLTMAGLPAGSVPYSLYLSDSVYSLPYYLSDIGYETFALHPYSSSSWNRTTAYPNLGFDNTLFVDDFNYSDEDFIRGKNGLIPGLGYISDECAYRNLIEMEDLRDSDAPAFYFLVTIQNHGGFFPSDESYEVREYVNDVIEPEEINNYLTLVNKSDEAFEYLINELSGSSKKYVVLMFGDHQPSLEAVTAEDEPGGRRWIVPYVLWTNYDMPDEYEGEVASSINYLPIDVLNAARLPLSPYFEQISEFRTSIPAVNASGYYSEELDSWCNRDEYSLASDEAVMNRYYSLVYYSLFDSSYED